MGEGRDGGRLAWMVLALAPLPFAAGGVVVLAVAMRGLVDARWGWTGAAGALAACAVALWGAAMVRGRPGEGWHAEAARRGWQYTAHAPRGDIPRTSRVPILQVAARVGVDHRVRLRLRGVTVELFQVTWLRRAAGPSARQDAVVAAVSMPASSRGLEVRPVDVPGALPEWEGEVVDVEDPAFARRFAVAAAHEDEVVQVLHAAMRHALVSRPPLSYSWHGRHLAVARGGALRPQDVGSLADAAVAFRERVPVHMREGPVDAPRPSPLRRAP